MPRHNPHKPFTPRAEQMALQPDVSGNVINGLGENSRRKARTVYWALNPDDIPHGRMQRWFYTADPENPHVNQARAWRAGLLEEEVGPLHGRPVERSPDEWLQALRDHANEHVPCERIGATPLDPDWLYEGVETGFSNVIMIAVQHDYEAIATAPDGRAGGEVIRQYGRAALSAIRIATWLRGQGWDADPVTGPMTGAILLIPPAIECGFGELGKHGSLIDPEFGSSFRLSAVLTNAPVAATPRREHGIDDFCMNCRVCEQACPPEAISPEKKTVRGQLKWYVDFDKCLPFFNQHHGCAICIAACPWSIPGAGLNLAEKLERRRERAQAAPV